MSTTVTEERPEETTVAPAARPRFRGRRFWMSLLVALVVIVLTIVAVLIESPKPDNSDFLSPAAEQDIGSSVLMEELTAAGIQVDRYTDVADGLLAAESGSATVFIPAPDYINSDQRYQLHELRAYGDDLAIVSVDPAQSFLSDLRLSKDGGARIATKTLSSDCGLPGTAGTAQLGRQSYRTVDSNPFGWQLCYDGHLAWSRQGTVTETIVGAADPFSNRGIDEADNRALATALLSGQPRVIWLDVHSLAPLTPPNLPSPNATNQTSFEVPRVPIQYPEANDTNPLYEALPSWLWAGLVGLLILMVLAALWRGRRLGPPVVEPLPVSVPAAETVYGRASLYQRAGAYPQAIRSLRAGAVHRIRPVIGVSSQAEDSDVVAAVARRTGWSSEQVAQVLFHTQPRDERELRQISHALDQLVTAVENSRPQGRDE